MTTRDWGGLGAVTDSLRRIAAEEAAKPETVCPVCGNYLDVNERGEKNCDVGHYRSSGQGR